MYIAHNRLPIMNEEQRQMFEQRFATAGDHMKHVPGFVGFQMLRASDNTHFLVSTTWESEEHFRNWTQSEHFSAAHGGQKHNPERAQVATYEVVYNA